MAIPSIIEQPPHSVSSEALTEILIRHFGIHEGTYALAINFRIGVGQVPGPNGASPVPGAMVGIEGVGIQPVLNNASGIGIVDAAVVNPGGQVSTKVKPARKKATSK